MIIVGVTSVWMVMFLNYGNGIPADLLEPIARTVHRVVGEMPVAIKCSGRAGVLVADGTVIDGAYEGRELDRAISRPGVTRVRLEDGHYPGKEMYASPIIVGARGEASCAIGVIDTSGALALKEFAEVYTELSNQVVGGQPPIN